MRDHYEILVAISLVMGKTLGAVREAANFGSADVSQNILNADPQSSGSKDIPRLRHRSSFQLELTRWFCSSVLFVNKASFRERWLVRRGE